MKNLNPGEKACMGSFGYPAPSWADFPGSAMIERWVVQLLGIWSQPASVVDRSRLVGLAAIVEHDYPRSVEALSQLIAVKLALPFKSIDPENEALPELSEELPGQPLAVLFLQSGSWQQAEAGAGTPNADTSTGRVRMLLERNFKNPSYVVLTTCREIEDLYPPLRRVSSFSRYFELPCPSTEQLGSLFLANCNPAWLAEEVRRNPRRVGLMLTNRHEGYEGRILARLFVERIFFLEERQVTLKDIASLDSLGAVESSRDLPLMAGFDERVAFHEAGHAAIALLDSDGNNVPEYVTIVPRGRAFGFLTTSREHGERRHLAYTYSMMLHDIRVTLGGRAAEEVIYGKLQVSDLCANDLERASDLVKVSVLKYGFHFASKMPPLPAFGGFAQSEDASFAQVQSNPAWREFVENEYQKTLMIALKNKSLIESIQRSLLRERVLYREDVESIWLRYKSESPASCQSAA